MQKYRLYLVTGLFLAGYGLITGCKDPGGNDPKHEQLSAAVSPVETSPAPAATANAAEDSSAIKSTIRIKAGVDNAVTDSQGNVWQPDHGFAGGDTISRDDNLQIANTTDPVLYRTEHYGMDSFSCKISNGKYLVKLHFAETFEGITGVGQRIFSFSVQGRNFKDFDVWQKAGGPNRAYIESVPVEVTDGKLQVTFTSNVENPEINAIEIIPQS
jgi:hypothetical protein